MAQDRAQQARDGETTAALVAAGWLVLRFWEHDALDTTVEAVVDAVRARRLR